MVTARSTVTPGAAGSTKEDDDAVVGDGRGEDPVGQVGLGNGPGRARHGEAVGGASGLKRRTPGGRGGRLGQGRAQADLARDHPGEPAGLEIGTAPAPQGKCAEDEGGPEGDGGHGPALLLEDEADLGETEAGAAVDLGDGQAEKVRPGQRGPELVVAPGRRCVRSRPPAPG